MASFLFSFLLLFHFQSQAYDYRFSPQSEAQVAKQASRWSLAQWMEQKGKIQWMDVWLHSNRTSPSYYEMYLGGDHGSYDRGTISSAPTNLIDAPFSSTSGHFGFFISWFGIHTEYEQSSDENRTNWDALAQLRLLGTSDQASHFVVFYGLKNNDFNNDQVLNQLFGGTLTLYLLNPWAIQARYQHLLSQTSNLGLEVDGYKFEASTWLEWGAFRLYGTWFHEPLESINAAGARTLTRREGFDVGLRVYLDFKK